MTTLTAWGPVADGVGAAVTGPPERRRFHSTPSVRYRRAQVRAPVHLNHDEGVRLGQVEYMELWPDKQLIAVASVLADDTVGLTDGDWYWSPSVRYSSEDPIDMLECSLVRSPASVALRPVTILAGDVRHRFARDRWHRQWSSSTRIHDMLERAADSAKRGGPIEIRTDARTEVRAVSPPTADRDADRWPPRPSGRIEHSPWRGRVLSVR